MNFSVYGIMDILHNTQGNFEESDNFKRHKTLFTLKSIREVCGGKNEDAGKKIDWSTKSKINFLSEHYTMWF